MKKFNLTEITEDIILASQDIKRKRRHLGITLNNLATHLGVVPGTVIRWEKNNYQGTTLDEFNRILRYLIKVESERKK